MIGRRRERVSDQAIDLIGAPGVIRPADHKPGRSRGRLRSPLTLAD